MFTYRATACYNLDCYHTDFTFGAPISAEAETIIKNANPGYMGIVLMARELEAVGCENPLAITTTANHRKAETALRVGDYFTPQKEGNHEIPSN